MSQYFVGAISTSVSHLDRSCGSFKVLVGVKKGSKAFRPIRNLRVVLRDDTTRLAETDRTSHGDTGRSQHLFYWSGTSTLFAKDAKGHGLTVSRKEGRDCCSKGWWCTTEGKFTHRFCPDFPSTLLRGTVILNSPGDEDREVWGTKYWRKTKDVPSRNRCTGTARTRDEAGPESRNERPSRTTRQRVST